MFEHYLTPLFSPRSVAIIGASEDPNNVGDAVFRNVASPEFRGDVYPVNPNHEQIHGRRCFPDIESVDHPVDLAVIATPAPTIPGIIEACGRHGTRAAVVMSAGFEKIETQGEALATALIRSARSAGVRFLGPNCLGIVRPLLGLNATFGRTRVEAGNLALVSQSGALCTAIMDWAVERDIGFSSIVSTGNSADIDFGEILDYLTIDHETDGILLYIEGLRDARRFMSALRAAARVKPVVVIKAGRFAAAGRAAFSHTGALVGNDEVFAAALARAGVVRADELSDFFSAAQILSRGLRTKGDRLVIITNGGGPGIMAADHLSALGLAPATLTPQTISELNTVLPYNWSHGNPIDLVGDAPAERYSNAITICLGAEECDVLLIVLTPQAMTDPLRVAQEVVALKQHSDKPVLCCWMGDQQVSTSRELFLRHHVPSFATPERAIDAFSYLVAYHRNQDLLLQVPAPLEAAVRPDSAGAHAIISTALAAGRMRLGEIETKHILDAFDIPVVEALAAQSIHEALQHASKLGYPVVMKIDSPDILHKSDVKGVRLNVTNDSELARQYEDLMESVRDLRPDAKIQGVIIEKMCLRPYARELNLGIATDPTFGPVISIGLGGTAVEALGDYAIALPPVNRFVARDLIRRVRAVKLLGQFRQLPAVDLHALENALLRISEMICELPEIRELDINPLLIDDQGLVALDARVLIAKASISSVYGHMAIHPYPSHLVTPGVLPDGTEYTIRPIRPEDAIIEREFVQGLSKQTRYFRFMFALKQLTPQALSRFTQIDYDREMAFIIVIRDQQGREREIGVARYATNPDGESCNFAIVIADEWQNRGLGARLLKILMDTARQRGLKLMQGEVLQENTGMLNLMHWLGFSVERDNDEPYIANVSKGLTDERAA